MKDKVILEYIKMHLRRYGLNLCIVIYNKPSCKYEVIITDIYKSPIDSSVPCVVAVLQGSLDKEDKSAVLTIRQWIKENFIIPDISDKEFKIQYALGTTDGGHVYRIAPEIAANYTFDSCEWIALSDIEWKRIEIKNENYYILQTEDRWSLCWEAFPKKVLKTITLNKEGTENLIKRGILFKTRQGNWKLSPKYLMFKLGQRHVTKK